MLTKMLSLVLPPEPVAPPSLVDAFSPGLPDSPPAGEPPSPGSAVLGMPPPTEGKPADALAPPGMGMPFAPVCPDWPAEAPPLWLPCEEPVAWAPGLPDADSDPALADSEPGMPAEGDEPEGWALASVPVELEVWGALPGVCGLPVLGWLLPEPPDEDDEEEVEGDDEGIDGIPEELPPGEGRPPEEPPLVAHPAAMASTPPTTARSEVRRAGPVSRIARFMVEAPRKSPRQRAAPGHSRRPLRRVSREHEPDYLNAA